MFTGLLVALIGAVLLLVGTARATAVMLIVLGGALFYGVVAYRVATARSNR